MSCERLKNILTELKLLINNEKANNQNYKDFFQKWNIPYNSNLEKKINDNCGSWNIQVGTNVMEIDQNCVKATKELCMKLAKRKFNPDTTPENLWPSDYKKCYWEFGPRLINNTQTNLSTVQSECRINTILGDPELTNNRELAVSVAMILSDRIINCDPNAVNAYYDAFSTNEKINSFSTCINSTLSEQQNYLKGCRLANKKQQNVNDVVQNCLIKTSFDRVTKKPVEVEDQKKSKQESTPSQLINPTLPEISQSITPIPIYTPTPQPLKNNDFMFKNTVIFGVVNVIIILLMLFVKKFFKR